MAVSAPRATRRVPSGRSHDPGVVAGGDRVEARARRPGAAAGRTSGGGCTRCTGWVCDRRRGRRRTARRRASSKSSPKLKTWCSMPRRRATARASSTSATEQQPESDAPPHSLRVTPTTSWPASSERARPPRTSRPRRTSRPARARRASCRRSVRARALQPSGRRRARRPTAASTSAVGGGPAEREPQRAARQRPVDPERRQHVRRLLRAARAARRGRRRAPGGRARAGRAAPRCPRRAGRRSPSRPRGGRRFAVGRRALDGARYARQHGVDELVPPARGSCDATAVRSRVGGLRGRRERHARRRRPACRCVDRAPDRRRAAAAAMVAPARITSAPMPTGPPHLCDDQRDEVGRRGRRAEVEPAQRLRGVGVEHCTGCALVDHVGDGRRAAGSCRSRC